MFALSPVATIPTALSVPASVYVQPVADAVSTRVTPVAVAAPLANSAVRNDEQASSAYLTQALAQSPSEDTQIALLSSYEHFTPAPAYNELLSDSVVKFRPSDAGVSEPGAESASSDTVPTDTAKVSQNPYDYRAYAAAASRGRSSDTQGAVVTVAG